MNLRIVKVGGSLLDWPPLPRTLLNWLADQPPDLNVLVCGGGCVADVIRRADRDFSLGDKASHWLCIDALSLTARLLQALLRQPSLLTSFETLMVGISQAVPGTVIFDPAEFLRSHEPRLPGRPLAHSWSVTSDSIAARLAAVTGAQELVLLKSSGPPVASWEALAAMNMVDADFPVAIAELSSVRVVNLRQEAFCPAT